MSTLPHIASFRLRLLLLLAALLGLTLGVQYYVNLRKVQSNTQLLAEQEQAIMAGVALGLTPSPAISIWRTWPRILSSRC